MKPTVVSYKVKPTLAEENDRLVAKVFRAVIAGNDRMLVDES